MRDLDSSALADILQRSLRELVVDRPERFGEHISCLFPRIEQARQWYRLGGDSLVHVGKYRKSSFGGRDGSIFPKKRIRWCTPPAGLLPQEVPRQLSIPGCSWRWGRRYGWRGDATNRKRPAWTARRLWRSIFHRVHPVAGTGGALDVLNRERATVPRQHRTPYLHLPGVKMPGWPSGGLGRPDRILAARRAAANLIVRTFDAFNARFKDPWALVCRPEPLQVTVELAAN